MSVPSSVFFVVHLWVASGLYGLFSVGVFVTRWVSG